MKVLAKGPSAGLATKDGASLGFETQLWPQRTSCTTTWNRPTTSMPPPALIFLNYIPDAFKAMRATLPGKDADDAMLVIKAGHISFKGMLPKEYVNSVEGDYGEPFEGRMQELAAALHEQQAAGATPGGAIAVNLQAQGLGDECG